MTKKRVNLFQGVLNYTRKHPFLRDISHYNELFHLLKYLYLFYYKTKFGLVKISSVLANASRKFDNYN